MSAESISKQPDFTGTSGYAWRVDVDALRRNKGLDPKDDALIADWVVQAPWAHPAWHSYYVTVIHLRPLPDARPTKFYLDGATHEIWVQAMDPDKPREPAILGEAPPWLLRPINFAAQFIAADDAEALARVEAAVRMVCDGHLSPDTDFISHWAHLFGGNMIRFAP